jgi:hypothetical protein
MDQESTTWAWAEFFIYCCGCFFIGLLTGVLRVPGVVAVSGAALVGAWGAWRRWFERPMPTAKPGRMRLS